MDRGVCVGRFCAATTIIRVRTTIIASSACPTMLPHCGFGSGDGAAYAMEMRTKDGIPRCAYSHLGVRRQGGYPRRGAALWRETTTIGGGSRQNREYPLSGIQAMHRTDAPKARRRLANTLVVGLRKAVPPRGYARCHRTPKR